VIAWARQMLDSLEGLRQGTNLVLQFVDLCQWVCDEFHVSIAQQTLSRELRAMGYRKLSARPRHHAQVEGAIVAFKNELGSAARLWW
jgi:hypothetical protein